MSVTFISVSWKNFLSTGNSPTTIQLNRSKTTLVQGHNGAGKSTMIDAITFALYNKPYRKINKAQLINSLNGKDCVVEIEFAAGNDTYRVVRGIKPAKFEIYKNGTLLNQDAANVDYQEMLERSILKMNYRTFLQVVVLGSGNYVPFMQLNASQRREIIEDLLDIQIFTKMNTVLKGWSQENKDAKQKARYDLSLAEERIAMQRKHISTLEQNSADLEDLVKAKIRSNEEESIRVLSEVERVDAELSALTMASRYSTLQKKLNDFSNAREGLIQKLTKIEQTIGFYHDSETCPTCKQGIEHDFRQSVITEKQAAREKIEAQMPLIDEKYKSLLDELQRAQEEGKQHSAKMIERSRLVAQLEMLKKTKQQLEEELRSLKKEKPAVADEQKKLQDLLGQQEAASEQLKAEIEKEALLAAAAALLKDSGIKSRIIKQYVPVINKLINKYLAQMDFFVQFELDEHFNETIRSRFRDDFSYASFSEGEKMRIDLAMLFAWRNLAKMRNSASTNLLIMDEVMDSSLDNSGTDDFLKIIDMFSPDTNTFVVSHKGDSLFDRFHSVIRFEKAGNFSKMV
jgi:DNA repair exonuclease SbcCD ATPase subunit